MYPERKGEPAGLKYTRDVIHSEVQYYITGKYTPPNEKPVKVTTNACKLNNVVPVSPPPSSGSYINNPLIITIIGILATVGLL